MWKPIDDAPTNKNVLGKSEDGIAEIEYSEKYKEWSPIFFPHHGCGCCSEDGATFTHFILLEDLEK